MSALLSIWMPGLRGRSGQGWSFALLALAATAPGVGAQRLPTAPTPPPWLRLHVETRSRVEHLGDDFRASAPGKVDALSFRTVIAAEAGTPDLFLAVELEDGRTYASEDAPLNTTYVNPVELLQARVVMRRRDVLAEGDALSLGAGRLTLDLGSRRLVARNVFRNTINGFTGIDVAWVGAGGHTWRGLALMPVLRSPRDAAGLEDNEIDVDREDTGAFLGGLFYAPPALAGDVRVEAYVLYYGERDDPGRASLNRHYLTPGLRVLRPPAAGRTDFEIELIAQVGSARATLDPADVTDLDHRAFSGHASIGHRFGGAWSPRFVLVYDFATGDRDPTDGSDERFDPLFGARRFELGPTGFYGAFARNNIRSPGARLEAAPIPLIDAALTYRPFWLDSAHDEWVAAEVRDPAGRSGTFLGHQVEASARARLLSGRLTLELGGAWLARGGFAKAAPGGREESPIFTYAQLTVTGDRS